MKKCSHVRNILLFDVRNLNYASIYRCHAIRFPFLSKLCLILILSDLMSNFIDLLFSLLLRKCGPLLMTEDKCTSINCKWSAFRIAIPPTALVELTIKDSVKRCKEGQVQLPVLLDDISISDCCSSYVNKFIVTKKRDHSVVYY